MGNSFVHGVINAVIGLDNNGSGSGGKMGKDFLGLVFRIAINDNPFKLFELLRGQGLCRGKQANMVVVGNGNNGDERRGRHGLSFAKVCILPVFVE